MNTKRKHTTTCLHNPPNLIFQGIYYNGEYLPTGTRIIRQIPFTISFHHSVVYGTDENNITWCIEKSGDGIRFVHINDVIEEALLEKIKIENPKTQISSNTILDRALQYKNPCYSLPFSNCEHFANWILTEYDISYQVDTVMINTSIITVGVIFWKIEIDVKTKMMILLLLFVIGIIWYNIVQNQYRQTNLLV